MEDMGAQLEQRGIFDHYRAIHQAYAQLSSAQTDQEALKRALFIQWYSLAEPSCFTGIGLLDAEAELLVLTQLDALLQTGTADAELVTMLQYYAYWDYAFNRAEFQHLVTLQTCIREYMGANVCPTAPPLRIHDMPNRGQMGFYWLT
ncbi:hypothetical protein [Solirubrum puertoriconensis]|nr:hypothetical protein [Solirubrum puertoriconensis]